MKRSKVSLDQITDLNNLMAAFHAAARGKRGRADVEAFRADLDHETASLQQSIASGTWLPGPMRRFRIRDPKPRLIHAPSFPDRVAHHAIIAHVGPVLDRVLVSDTYACRPGKGALAAVRRAGEHAARGGWHAQIDVRAYFASIDHGVLLSLLARKFGDRALIALLTRIVEAHESGPGRGLPIGTLTSQQFANFYLAGVERLLLETCRVRGLVRYMDDLVWWTDDRAAARSALADARGYLADTLRLEVKQPVYIGRNQDGLTFCGFRILPGRTLLSRRRRRRYAELRRDAEASWLDGQTDAAGLQSAYSTALALTIHADAAAWRRGQLRRHNIEESLEGL